MTTHTLMHVQTNRDGVVSRRTFLRTLGAGAALGAIGWKDALTLRAQELQQRGMACVLLFMRGGPSQFETFDPKPGHANGGPRRPFRPPWAAFASPRGGPTWLARCGISRSCAP